MYPKPFVNGPRLAVLVIAALLAALPLDETRIMASDGANPRTGNPPSSTLVLGMGCFWGAEKRMAALPGVLDVVSGYAGGDRPNPGYQQILADEGRPGRRNHAEVVRVEFDPARTSVEQILARFWENHDPTQGDRQGNDLGSNYRSAIYYDSEAQRQAAQETRERYQQALTAAGLGRITTEIAPLRTFYPAEDYHQDYLKKNPKGYCGLGGTGVKFPAAEEAAPDAVPRPLDAARLSAEKQLIVFEAKDCPFCLLFRKQVLSGWSADLPIAASLSPQPPPGWSLKQPLWATPTIVLFRGGREQARYTGYHGEREAFWKWLGQATLTEEQRRIAFAAGTERPFSGSLLDNHRPGVYVDPVSGAPLFRSGAKFDSGTGWPSFFDPIEGAVTLHEDHSHGLRRVEVRSASTGIHLGHVFDDGPPPTGRRYCINSEVLRFVADEGE